MSVAAPRPLDQTDGMGKGRHDSSFDARLRRLQDEGRVVRIGRDIRGADVLEGVVVDVDRKWTVLARITDFHHDGWCLVRTRDVRRLQPDRAGDAVERFLRGRGQWPLSGPEPALRLGSTKDLVRDAAATGLAASLHVEREDPDICFVGRIVGTKRRRVSLAEVSPQGEWQEGVSRWRFREITRLDLGARYETAVLEAAGPPPAV